MRASGIKIGRSRLARRRTAAACLLAGLVASLPAQAADDSENEVYDVGPVLIESEGSGTYSESNSSVGTRTSTPIMQTPASVKVVPRKVIEDQNLMRLEDVLSSASGMVFTEGPEALGFRSRGFPLQILHDGVQRSELANGDMQVHDLELYNVERVEILKGPSSFLYGRGNPGGTINVVTKRPQATPGYEAAITGGQYTLIRPSVDLTGPIDEAATLRYRFNGMYETADSFRDEIESERVFVMPSILWAPKEGSEVWASFEHVDIEETPDGGVPRFDGEILPGLDRTDFFGEPTDYRKQKKNQVQLGGKHALGENWSVNASASYVEGHNEQNFTRGGGLQADGRTLTRTVRRDKTAHDSVSIDAYVRGDFATWDIGHSVAFGGSYHWVTNDPLFQTAPAATIDVFNPVYGNADPTGPFNVSDTFNERSIRGLYVEDKLSLTDQVTVVAGGRLDFYDAQSENNGTAGPRKEQTAFSPRLGIVYQPIRELSLYAGYAESFQSLSFALQADGSLVDPEQSTLYEAGVKLSLFDDRLNSTLAVYQILRDDIVVSDPANPGFQINNGEQRSRGIELDIGGEVLPGWNVIGGYSFTEAEITENSNADLVGNEPANVPAHTAALWTTYELQSGPLKGLGFGGGLRYVGERPGADDNDYMLDGYTLFDAVAYYEYEGWRLQANVKNIFDTDYVVSRGGNFVFVGEPLTATLTARYRF